jgi:hypothetical protein
MATQFQDLLHSMVNDAGVLEMDAVVKYAAVAITGADHAAITLERAGRPPETVYSTGELPLRVDALQYRFGEGPCVAALAENDLVWVNDLAEDDRFPQFSPGAVDLGVRSMLSTRLFLSKDDRAALNLYSTRPRAFQPAQLPLAAIFASYASLLLVTRLQEDRITHLERALDSNREIGVAIGILMAEQRCTRDDAFQLLVTASQSLNRRLKDIAEEVNRTGELPFRPSRRSSRRPPAIAEPRPEMSR